MREYVWRYMYVLQHSPLFGSYLTNMSVKFWQEHVQQRHEWQFGALVTCAELSWWRGCWRGQLNVFITRLPARFRVPLTGGSEGCAVTSGAAGLVVVVAAEQVEGWQEVPHSAAADAERRRWGCEVYLCVRGGWAGDGVFGECGVTGRRRKRRRRRCLNLSEGEISRLKL